jgi:hypothetical protein
LQQKKWFTFLRELSAYQVVREQAKLTRWGRFTVLTQPCEICGVEFISYRAARTCGRICGCKLRKGSDPMTGVRATINRGRC